MIPPLFVFLMADACVSEELLSSCASFCLRTVSLQSVLSYSQNGVKCVGALSLHGQRLFYGQVNSLSQPYGGLWSVTTAPYFFKQ